MIVGSAGHVDHGKTALIARLTGTDADRLPEEKRRGMTIDLGYAYLALPDGRRLGFIDVPGHEHFLANMLAGVGGIDHALLVVAADDGIMPQTVEHLSIVELLGIASASVALTKCDLVATELITARIAEIQAGLAHTALAGSPVFPLSSHSGAGIADLAAHLAVLPQPCAAARERRFRLAIDRCFTVRGVGVVVTGTALAGRVQVGDTLWLTGAGRPVRVRGIHAQNQPAETGEAHQRLALNLGGDIERAAVSRGDWLLAGGPPPASERVTVWLQSDRELARPLTHWQAVHLHHAASHATGRLVLLEPPRIEAGQGGLAELALDRPWHLADGDRLIVRDASAQATLASARVLEVAPPQRAKRAPARLAHLALLAQTRDDRAVLAALSGQGAVALPAFGWARQLDQPQCETLGREQGLKPIGGRDGWLYAPAYWQAMREALLAKLAGRHEQRPDEIGVARSVLRRLALPQEPAAAVDAVIDELVAAGALANTRGWLHLPAHRVSFSAEQEALWLHALPHLQQAEACWVRDLAGLIDVPEEAMRTLLTKAARQGLAVAVVPDRYYAHERMRVIAATAKALAAAQGFVEASALRDALGVGRKLAIQILEYLDRAGLTRRLGNRHWLRDVSLFEW